MCLTSPISRILSCGLRGRGDTPSRAPPALLGVYPRAPPFGHGE